MTTLELRENVHKTDKKYTKELENWLTGIDAYSQIKKATELRWPYWSKRWFEEIKIDVKEVWGYVVSVLNANFYYPEWTFPIWNNINWCWTNVLKILQTDTLTKALSMLWFNADVFLWEFTDIKAKWTSEEEALKWFKK